MIAAYVAIAILAAACIYLGVRLDRTTKERNSAQQRVDLLETPWGHHHPNEPDWIKGAATYVHRGDITDIHAPYFDTAFVVPVRYGKEVCHALNKAERYGRDNGYLAPAANPKVEDAAPKVLTDELAKKITDNVYRCGLEGIPMNEISIAKAGFVNGLRYARDNGYLAPGLTAQNGRENPKS